MYPTYSDVHRARCSIRPHQVLSEPWRSLHWLPQVKFLSLGPHLFLKVLRPGDSEVTFSVFKSSCPLLLPV